MTITLQATYIFFSVIIWTFPFLTPQFIDYSTQVTQAWAAHQLAQEVSAFAVDVFLIIHMLLLWCELIVVCWQAVSVEGSRQLTQLYLHSCTVIRLPRYGRPSKRSRRSTSWPWRYSLHTHEHCVNTLNSIQHSSLFISTMFSDICRFLCFPIGYPGMGGPPARGPGGPPSGPGGRIRCAILCFAHPYSIGWWGKLLKFRFSIFTMSDLLSHWIMICRLPRYGWSTTRPRRPTC